MHRYVLAAVLLLAAPTASLAASCDAAVRGGLPQLGADTVVQLQGQPTVAAGQTFTLHWQRGPFPDRYPAYLMIAFDGPVRFEGKGFYALLPNAQAAFGIKQFADRTRAVIPYYGLGVPREGEVIVRPLLAGPLNVQWAVVGHDHCREYVAERGSGSATLRVEATGNPEIVVKPFAAEQPKERIYSPAGGRVIEIYDKHYRLVDEASRAELAERAGHYARFSPTGRYLAAYTENGVEILDTVDGRTVYKQPPAANIAWDDADSFAILDHGSYGSIAVLAPSLADPVVFEGSFGCHACSATESVAVRVDLENNVVIATGSDDIQGSGAASLTVKAKIPADLMADVPTFAQVSAFVRQVSQVTTFALPKRWELHGGLKFSHLLYEAEREQNPKYRDAFQELLMRFLVKPIRRPVAGVAVADKDAVRVAQWRAATPSSDSASERNILKRLQDFGLPIPKQARDPTKAPFRREIMKLTKEEGGLPTDKEKAGIRAVAQRIQREVPAASDVFVARAQDDFSFCIPEAYDKGKRYPVFQKAIRFQGQERTIWITHYQCREGSGAFSYASLVLFDSRSAKALLLDQLTGNPKGDVGNRCYGNIDACTFNAEMFGDRFLVLSSADSRAIEIYDLEARRNVFKKYDVPRGDLLKQVMLSPDGKLVLQINSDGSFVGYRLADAMQLFEGRYVDDEVIVWAPDGRFDATSEGAHYVSLRLPGRIGTHTFAQFSARLRTPGLIGKLMAGETFPPVTLVSPPSLTGAIEARNGRLTGAARATGDTPLAALLIYQDGLLTDRLETSAGTNASWDIDVALLDGTRWVSMVAVDRDGLASLPMGRDVGGAQAPPHRVHVLAIGIDDYTDPRILDLNLAQSDARHFAQAVGAAGRDVVVASSRVLDQKNATREGVLAALREVIAAAKPGETVLLSFAGHGVRTDDGRYFLATVDTQLDDIPGTALPWDAVAEVLSKSRTRIALFLDSCHSGSAGTGAFTTNDAAAKSLLERIPSGIVVFSASKGRELSEETSAVGGGVFTSSLVNVIARDRARYDTNKDGAIEISELYRGVKSQVAAVTDGRQTPWIARNQMVGDFVLF